MRWLTGKRCRGPGSFANLVVRAGCACGRNGPWFRRGAADRDCRRGRNSVTPALPPCSATAPVCLRYTRRPTREVMVGGVGIGGRNPIRVQSMITADTRDTAACVSGGAGAWPTAGCEIVRITAQTKVYAANLEHIAREVRAGRLPGAAGGRHPFQAGRRARSRRMGRESARQPGQLRRQEEVRGARIHAMSSTPRNSRASASSSALVRRCKELGRAMRIGTNHGSLSRPHHEPLRRHAARHGRERARVRPHRPRRGLPRLRLLDEGVATRRS